MRSLGLGSSLVLGANAGLTVLNFGKRLVRLNGQLLSLFSMGKMGKEIVRANLKEVIKDLNTAYSDEWLAHFQYWYMAKWIKGIDADTLRPVLEKQSADELGHAEKLAERIIQLGGRPVAHPAQLLKLCGCGFKEPPSRRTDLKGVIRDVLEAEACAIGFYSKMAEKYRVSDLVTHEIFEDLLKDEVSDEEEWEDFLDSV